MSAPAPRSSAFNRKGILLLVLAFLVGAGLTAGLAALLVDIQQHKTEALEFPLKVVPISSQELDPAVWGRNFSREYATFVLMKDDTIQTPFGGSVPFDKLARDPLLKRLYAGNAFSAEFNKARGHAYALEDQKKTKRIQVANQPGACANCHAAEAPQLIEQMGWETFNKTPYNDLKDRLHTGTSCADCHDPETMDLRISRPAFLNAMKARGIDVTQASRQEMRTYVCAQCHVEYYFSGDNKVLTFPWTEGYTIDNIESYYTKINFKDFVHAETGAPMLKMQHPEFEIWSTGIHAQSNVACADCHMPYIRDGSVKVSDHWLRSPLVNINRACQPCHRESEEELKTRVVSIQKKTVELRDRTEQALTQASDAIQAAKAAGTPDTNLDKARQLYRSGSMRWDFVSSENSTGFHSPQETARILGAAIDLARQSQFEALRVRYQSQ